MKEFGIRKYKEEEYHPEICICGHDHCYHEVPLLAWGGACERCCCHKYKIDLSLPTETYSKPIYSFKEKLRSII